MEDLRQITIDTYNESAQALAEYVFANQEAAHLLGCTRADLLGRRLHREIVESMGPIDFAISTFESAGEPHNPNVLEIGCGDGRDAKAIVARTPNYLGTDISVELIRIAKKHVPEGKFEVADAATQKFPEDLDICFAFASLLHLNKSELQTVFGGVAKVLRPGGIFYISSKYHPEYTEEIKEDRFGKRLFYFYNAELMAGLAGSKYETVKAWREVRGNTDWFELVLRKVA